MNIYLNSRYLVNGKKIYKASSQNKKKPRKKVINNNILNKFDDNNNLFQTKNKKSLAQMMRDYKLFVKKYFGDTIPQLNYIEEKPNYIIDPNQNLQNIFLCEKNQLVFAKLLKYNQDLYFEDEDIPIPSKSEIIYESEQKLGKNKNNKADYSLRKNRLISEAEEIIREKKEISAKKIQQIFRKKRRKEKIYQGFDPTNRSFLKIYVKEYDKEKKLKSIEIFIYFLSPYTKEFNFVKEIKDILGVYSISKKEIINRIGDIINKMMFLIFDDDDDSDDDSDDDD
jgi:hypothetical protein